MTTVAKIQAELDLDTGRFRGSVTSALGAVKKFDAGVERTDRSLKNIERRVTGLGASLRDTMVVLGQFRAALHTIWMFTGEWARAIVDANAKLERMQVLLKGLSTASTEAGRTADALKNMNYVLRQAKTAPFAVDEIANAFVKLKASGIDPTAGAMQALMDSVARFGGDDQVFHRATIAIQQMSGKGVISMEELRQQLGEAIPNAMQLMARSLNMTVGELVKVISTGRLEASSALAALFREMDYAFAGSAKNMMTTWTGMVSRLKTEWMIFAKAIGDAGMFEMAKQSLSDLTQFLQSDEGKQFARDLGYSIANVVKALADFIRFLVQHRSTIADWGKLLLQIFIAKKVGEFTVQIVGLAGHMTGFIGTLGKFGAAWRGAGAGMAGFMARLGMLAGPLGIAATAIAFVTIKLWDQARAADAAHAAMVRYHNATVNGIAVSPQEHQAMIQRQKFIEDARKRLNEAFAEYQGNANNRYARENAKNVLGEVVADMREMGMIDSEGNFFTDSVNIAADVSGAFTQAFNVLAVEFSRGGVVLQQAVLQDKAATERVVSEYALSLDEHVKRAAGSVGQKLNEIQAKVNAGTFTMEQAATERTKVLRRHHMNEINMLLNTLHRQEIILANAKGNDAKVLAVTQVMEETKKRLERAYADYDSVGGEVTLLDKIGGDTDKKSDIVKLLESLIGKNAQLHAQLDDGIPTLEKFRTLLGLGTVYEGATAGIVAEIEALIMANDELEKKIKANKATDKIVASFEEMEASANADVISAKLKSSGDMYSQVAAGMVGFRRQVEILRLTLPDSNMKLEEFNAKMLAIQATIADADLINFRQFVVDREFEAYLDSLPRREREIAEFTHKLKELDSVIGRMKLENPENATELDALAVRLRATFYQEHQNAIKPAWKTLMEDWYDTTTAMDNMWANSMQNMADTLTEFITTGKASFRDLATSILKEITRILISKALAQLVDVILKMTGSWFGGGPTGNEMVEPSGYAKGGAFANGIQRFANGGAFTNKITNGTNIVPMAMLGEQGAEAIMPLRRDASGRLGVMAQGGSGVVNQITIEINIDGDGNSSESANGDMGSQGAALGQALKARVKQTLNEEMMPGGILYNIRTGR